MTPYSPASIAKLIDATLSVYVEGPISRLLIDSRSVFEARDTLFFALRGSSHDGHQFLDDLFNRGVRNFVVEQGRIPAHLQHLANWMEVVSPPEALQKLAARHREAFHIPVLAITGSNGKTIVKEWLAQMIGSDLRIARSPRSYNSQTGVPLSVWQMDESSELAVIEAGISMPGEMPKLERCIRPTLGLFTTLGQAHQENFASLTQKLNEKLNLFQGVKTLFYCSDMELVDQTVRARFPDKELVTWGRHRGAHLLLQSHQAENDHTTLQLYWKGASFEVAYPFSDPVSLENVMHTLLFLLYRGYSPAILQQRIMQLQPVAMRLEQKAGSNNCLIINDTYNADITSLEVALEFLVQQSRKRGAPRTVILSDLLQTGIPDAELYPKIARLLNHRDIDRFIGIGPSLQKFASHFKAGSRFFYSTASFLAALPRFSFSDEAILIKGSRRFSFERIVERLELQKHATVLEIDLNALVHNLNAYRSLLQPGTRVLVMVKAFSYGSGSYEIAAALQHHNVDYLGVAFADEGIELRKAGISLPVMVMNPGEHTFAAMIEYNLEPEIYSFRMLKAFYREVEAQGITGYPIHLKIDTGMHRLGFLPDETTRLVDRLRSMPSLRVKSVFSHLAGSEDKNHDDFTRQQIDLYQRVCRQLEVEAGISFWRHILNSAGTERFPQARFDMVRLGIGLYGFGAGKLKELHNVVSLKTYVLQVKDVGATETIGYGRAGRLNGNGRIAVLPIGYADGLNRHLGNRAGKVIIKGHSVPLVGNICMDTCMADVSGVEVSEGDEVMVFGDGYPLINLARQLNTIPYEILTGISRRVRRVYFRE